MSFDQWLAPGAVLGVVGLGITQLLAYGARKKKEGADEEKAKALLVRVAELEAKPAADIASVAEKIKSDLSRELGDRIAQAKSEWIEDGLEVKQRVQAIELARAEELRARAEELKALLKEKSEEFERLKRKQSDQRFQAVTEAAAAARRDPRAEPVSDTPPQSFDTEAPPRPSPPRRR